MKEYFSHDYNSRNDTKIVKLFMKFGLKGIGAYWCIIEMLYEEDGYLLRSEYERISFELRTDIEFIKSIIEEFNLFEKDNKKFWSETAINRLNKRMEKSNKARESVQKRWNKYNGNTNVLEKKNDSNTSKVKESKVKESKNIPTYSEFEQYALSKKNNIDKKQLKLKYEAWRENNWKDGNNKKINNWKTKLLNTIPYLKESEGNKLAV